MLADYYARPLLGESREEFEADRMGQTGADNARRMRERSAEIPAPPQEVFDMLHKMNADAQRMTGADPALFKQNPDPHAKSIAAHSVPQPRVVATPKEAAQAAAEMKTPPVKKVAPKKRLCRFCEKPLERWSATMMRCPGCGRNEAL